MEISDLKYPLTLDGGFATELIKAGYNVDGDPLWSTRVVIEHPNAIVDAHRRFLRAGARIIETCTYQAGLKLLQSELKCTKQESADVLKKAVKLARQAITEFRSENPRKTDEKIFVAGSVGPYGTVLCDGSEYTGSYMKTISSQEIVDYYTDQCKILIESDVDLLAFDTIPALSEAICILEALGKLPKKFCWISFSCKDSKSTCFGDDFATAAKQIEEAQFVHALGINCTMPDLITPLMKSANFCSKPFVIYPNSGEIWQPNKEWTQNPECSGAPVVNYVPEWISLGAKILGGCCRIGPENIWEIAEAVKKHSS